MLLLDKLQDCSGITMRSVEDNEADPDKPCVRASPIKGRIKWWQHLTITYQHDVEDKPAWNARCAIPVGGNWIVTQ